MGINRKKAPSTSAALESVLTNLTTLTPEELSTVIKRSTTLIKAQGGNPHTDLEAAIDPDDWILDGLYNSFATIGRKLQLVKRSELIGMPAFRHYSKFAPNLRKMIEQKLGVLSPPQKIYFGNFLGQLFLDYIAERTELTFSKALWRIEDYAAAIDDSFPGYMDSGLMNALLQGNLSA